MKIHALKPTITFRRWLFEFPLFFAGAMAIFIVLGYLMSRNDALSVPGIAATIAYVSYWTAYDEVRMLIRVPAAFAVYIVAYIATALIVNLIGA